MKRALALPPLLVLFAAIFAVLDWARQPPERRRFLVEERLPLIAGE